MDLEALDSLELVVEKKALPEQVEEQGAPPVMVEKAQPDVSEELSP